MWMMVLEALLNINLALLNSDIDSADLSLKSMQNIHHLSKASIIRWRRRRRQLHADHPVLEEAEVLHIDPQTEAEH
jgi:hypothetical protein